MTRDKRLKTNAYLVALIYVSDYQNVEHPPWVIKPKSFNVQKHKYDLSQA